MISAGLSLKVKKLKLKSCKAHVVNIVGEDLKSQGVLLVVFSFCLPYK